MRYNKRYNNDININLQHLPIMHSPYQQVEIHRPWSVQDGGLPTWRAESNLI